MNEKFNILITARFDKTQLTSIQECIASVKYRGWGVDRRLLDESRLIDELKDVDIFISEYEPISSKVIRAAENLKLIACCRNEPLASIDIEDATERGIPVIYPQGRNAVSVAEFAFGLMISVSRNIHKVYHLIKYTTEITRVPYRTDKKGRMGAPSEWSFDPRAPLNRFGGPELANKVLGIVGLGAIGCEIALRANAFQMKVYAYDPYAPDLRIEKFGVSRKPLEELIRASDYIVIAARVSEDNKGMISEELFRLMKPTAFFINVARAHHVDYDALYTTLKNKGIAGAALDVYPVEPIPEDYPFIDLDNVILSPHLGGSSTDIEKHHSRMIVDDISLILNGNKPVNLLNPESWQSSYFKQHHNR